MRLDRPRSGSILVLSAFLMLVMLGMVAFALDTGYIVAVKTQLQAAADAGALAGVTGLPEGDSKALSLAQTYAQSNFASGRAVEIVPGEDLQLGYWNAETRQFQTLSAAQPTANALRVTSRLSTARGNQANLFFARALGRNNVDLQATAVAVLPSNFKGFKTPPAGENLMILPFALDLPTWEKALANIGSDQYGWDPETQSVFKGPDGHAEVNLHPEGNHLPGNRGIVDIGPSGGKTPTLRTQIVDGLTTADLNHHGGKLELDYKGELVLSGATGVRATLGDELSQIIGQPRILPIFSKASGNGTNAKFTITQFAGVRIIYVNMTGNPKQILLQPANIATRGGIPADPGETSSQHVYGLPYRAN